MDPTDRRRLGSSDVTVTQMGFGGVSIGELFTRVDERQAADTLDSAWDHGMRYFDTAPLYGRGLSEHRIGRLLQGKPAAEVVISTKVGRVLVAARDPAAVDAAPWVGGLPFEFHYDYGYDGIMRSYEDSLARLGLPRVDLLVVHDLDYGFHRTTERVGAYLSQLAASGWRALSELRDAGLIKGIGVGINERALIPRFLDAIEPDFFLLAMRYTLLEQDVLDDHLPRCASAGVGIVIGSVFNSGILATGAVAGAKYNYGDPTPEVLDRVRRMTQVCLGHGIPLAAAALQFPLGHPSVAAVIPGVLHPDQVKRNDELFRHPIPADFWRELKHEGLLRQDAPTPA